MKKRYLMSMMAATVITVMGLNACAGLTQQSDKWLNEAKEFGVKATDARSMVLVIAGGVYQAKAAQCEASATTAENGIKRVDGTVLYRCMRSTNDKRARIESAATVYATAVESVLKAESLEDVIKRIPAVKDAAQIFSATTGDMGTFTQTQIKMILVDPPQELEREIGGDQ